MKNARLLVLVLASCSAAHAEHPVPQRPADGRADAPDRVEPGTPDAASHRREGPPALERLLVEWDRTPPGPARDRLEGVIDRVAAQRYATVSRLYWYTDLDEALATSRASGKPVLSLRLLGRLDEDLSCANSRMFRVVLYANEQVAATLRRDFVLHWSSVRAAPRITVDLGDGRQIVRTVTGNSAHFVLDSAGRPLDVLPGLYAPAVFLRELQADLELARRLASLAEDARAAALADEHRRRLAERSQTWSGLREVALARAPTGDTAVLAQLLTQTKSAIELPLYRAVDLGPKVGELPDDADAWAQLGARLVTGGPAAPGGAQSRTVRVRAFVDGTIGGMRMVDPPVSLPGVLDPGSRALLERLRPLDWTADGASARGARLQAIVDGLARDVLADTAINEFQVRLDIQRAFASRAGATASFEALDGWVYDGLFRTPRRDPWLGLGGTFAALPRDGVVLQ